VKKCSLCGHVIENSIFTLENMPFSAQGFLNENEILNDKSITLNICQCNKCGLVQLDNKVVPYYKDVIRATAYSSEMQGFRLKQFSEFVDRFNLKEKKVIEIGSGRGEYLELMSKFVTQCYGIEHNTKSVDIARKKDQNVFQGYLEDKDYIIDNSPYDAFFIMSFLEHIPNLNSFLEAIYNNLSNGAVGLIEVPNFDMIIKNNLFSEFISDHLYYFTKETFRRVLEVNGFEVIEIRAIWYDYIISAIVKKREKIDLSNFMKIKTNLKISFNNLLKQYNKVAVWGAGHQSLALISLMNIKDKIEFIIDSASFKQGLYTPATHLKIYSPDKLTNSKIEAIIVIAGSYNEEVIKTIKNMKIDIKIFQVINGEIASV
jgi:2-polyprenyl-3-methyl-5-hydroxy-6-metoxy-1,4-benzoquinol methylase